MYTTNHSVIVTLVNMFVVVTVGIGLNPQQVCMKLCLRNDNKVLFTQPLRCFNFRLPNLLFIQNFVYQTTFSLVPPPAINNDWSLRGLIYG